MRSHISVHGATTKYFSNSFIFKNNIEKEGLPRDSPAGLGAGGPEFNSRCPDQSFLLLDVGDFFLAIQDLTKVWWDCSDTAFPRC